MYAYFPVPYKLAYFISFLITAIGPEPCGQHHRSSAECRPAWRKRAGGDFLQDRPLPYDCFHRGATSQRICKLASALPPQRLESLRRGHCHPVHCQPVRSGDACSHHPPSALLSRYSHLRKAAVCCKDICRAIPLTCPDDERLLHHFRHRRHL